MADKKKNDKPPIKLVGTDGNAFAVIGLCRRAAKDAGWSGEQISEFINVATSGDYNHLLATAIEYFDVK